MARLSHMNCVNSLCPTVPGSSCLLPQFTIHVVPIGIFLRSKSHGVLLRNKKEPITAACNSMYELLQNYAELKKSEHTA